MHATTEHNNIKIKQFTWSMSFLLSTLPNKKDVDDAILTTEDKVLVLRFGRAEHLDCLVLDDVVR